MSNNIGNRWDVFCKIVDNYGDIGVCWRLSQQLAHEHHLHVRLLIDDFPTASKIIPQLTITPASQIVNGVEICTWPQLEMKSASEPADVVLETFSCGLPDVYTQQMQPSKTVWINLEYLSAEAWVSDFHAKPSPHPTLPFTKYFFFPGFFNDTGGLIRETNLIAQRDTFLSSKIMQDAFWQKLGADQLIVSNSIKISLFCYPQTHITHLFSALENSDQPISLLLPFNGSITTLNTILADFKLADFEVAADGKVLHRGNLSVYLIPFLSQADYDYLLWACDLNFVRGEDSWIRAIWAGKPFIWQPYRQVDDVHINKLNAFLEVYASDAPSDVKSVLNESHLAWSRNISASGVSMSSKVKTQKEVSVADSSQSKLWQKLISYLPILYAYTNQQTNTLAKRPDLATKLVIFSENSRKNKV